MAFLPGKRTYGGEKFFSAGSAHAWCWVCLVKTYKLFQTYEKRSTSFAGSNMGKDGTAERALCAIEFSTQYIENFSAF